MKKVVKSFLLVVMLLLIFPINKAFANTGYKEFKDIEIIDRDDVYLLINNSRKNKNENLKNVKWKLFGPSVYISFKNVDVKYKKHDLFSRSNKTSNVLEYEYTYTKNTKTKLTVESSKTEGLNISGKFDKFSASIEEAIKNSIGTSTEVSISKELSYTITVDPYTKVTVYVTGDAYLSQGAVKYYFFGIPIYKSNWEQIDILTEYYELYEESYR